MSGIKFEIKEKIGEICELASGWKKELNFISWNGNEAKYDIREWDLAHEKMGKGCTFTKEELIKLRDILNGMQLDGSKGYNKKSKSKDKNLNQIKSDIKSIYFFIGGFMGTSHYVYIERKTDSAIMKYLCSDGFTGIDIKDEFPEELNFCEELIMKQDEWGQEVWDKYSDELSKCNVEAWAESYSDPDILDGTSWEINIEFDNGKDIVRHGNNAYPESWKKFVKVMKKYIDKNIE